MSAVPARSPAAESDAPFPAPAGEITGLHNQLLGSLAAAVYACDAEGRITFYNAAAADLWGRRPEVGRDLWCGSWKIFTPAGEPLPPERCPMAVALKEGRSVRGVEIVVERPDGARRHILPHPEPVRDAAGRFVGAVNLLVDVTSQREAERAQAHLAAIVESSDDAIISKTLEGRITSWNSGAERIFGYRAEEIIGRPITTLIPQERLPEEDRILARLRRGERIDHFQTVRVAKDGRRLDISLTVSPVRDASGRLIGASKVARDITDQKRAEEALRRSERNLADFFENAAIGLHWVDAEGVIIRANRAELAMLGYSAEEYVGRRIAEFHVDRDALGGIRERLERGEEIVDHPARLRRKDGAVRHVLISSNALLENGRFIRTRTFTRDVTEQVMAQRALAESESRLRTLLSVLPAGVYSCDADGRITFYNRRAVELWGQEPDTATLHYCAFRSVFFPDGTFVPADRTPMAQAVREGRSFRNVEAVMERHDGSRFHASVNIEPVRDGEGRVIGAINVLQDISVQVAAREALQNQRRALEDAVARRTAELEESHRRLRASERMASLGTLSAGLGHDMGNLLLPVRVSLEALAAADLPGSVRGDIERIRTSARYLQQLANGLRMMALDPERAATDEPTRLGDWWADAASVVKNALPRGVALGVDIPGDLWASISRPALTQVVFNLAQNAGEALRDRSDGHVRIGARLEGDRVLLRVEDNGPGMTEEVRARCMEPFFTTKSRGISTGLGLVLVGGLVREAGGTVRVESRPGLGTTFVLTLRAATPPAERPEATTPRGCAAVCLRDARLRAIVASELGRLAVEVRTGADAGPVDVAVTDELAHLPPAAADGRRIVLFAEANGQRPGVRAIGRRPKLGVIRDALREAIAAAPDALPSGG